MTRTLGSVRGAVSNGGPYRDPWTDSHAGGCVHDDDRLLRVAGVFVADNDNGRVVQLSPSVPSGSLSASPVSGPAGSQIREWTEAGQLPALDNHSYVKMPAKRLVFAGLRANETRV